MSSKGNASVILALGVTFAAWMMGCSKSEPEHDKAGGAAHEATEEHTDGHESAEGAEHSHVDAHSEAHATVATWVASKNSTRACRRI